MVRKVKFQPIAEMVGEDDFQSLDLPTSEGADAFFAEQITAPTPPHDWISYFGAPDAYAPDGEPLSPDTALFVVTKTAHPKINPARMTVAEMVKAAESDDYPVMYRLA